ncbi:MAG: hypothetical protein E3J90_07880 [Promethearchaeota archaeon]|nr:MAG: hypothetical protein E3J90_07880 [Candidatus Lokiarchaeota archaeon]
MNELLSELDSVFQSPTIKPTFDYVHVVLSLFLFGENTEGIGRYRLQKELEIGAGTVKSLFNKLKTVTKYIIVPSEGDLKAGELQRRGHVLTQKGFVFLAKVKKKIPLLRKADLKYLKEIIIKQEDVNSYFCLVKKSSTKLRYGVEQRDAAIKVNGSGATCLVYDGVNLFFPTKSKIKDDTNNTQINPETLNYFKSEIEAAKVKIEKNDVIIIGSGDNYQKARLATLNAALTLL